jgi:5'-3' exonuclease, N-terminal resolvase-like domain
MRKNAVGGLDKLLSQARRALWEALHIHLVDGTYELFRHYYALPSARDQDGCEVAAVRGVLASILGMIKNGVTHVAVATDHVIESFRNDLWPGYKTGEGIEPGLLAQFSLLEDVLSAARSRGLADGRVRGGRCARFRGGRGSS